MTIKDLPPANSSMFLDRVREVVQTLIGRGNPSDRAVTVNDLDRAGIASDGGGRLTDPTPDMTVPPTPTGFTATAGTTRILFMTDTPRYTVGHGHARTIIYAANWDGVSPLPTFSDAVEFFNYAGPIDSAPYDPASNLRLWARWKTVDGALSTPAGGTNGISVTMGLVDDLMIASMSVAKLLAGSLSVGQYIQSADYVANTSGWRIQTLSGGAAFMEVNGGAIIGGAVIGATYIQSSNYSLDTTGWRLSSNGTGQIGAFKVLTDAIQSTNYVVDTTGWKLKNDGTGQIGGFRVTSNGIHSAGYVAGTSGWKIDQNGSIEAANLTLTGGVVRNSSDSFHMDMNATGSSLLLRAGAFTSYGPYAGSHYKVEIYANGAAFFGREVVAGGTLKASGTYAIPDKERPAVCFKAAPPPAQEDGGYGP